VVYAWRRLEWLRRIQRAVPPASSVCGDCFEFMPLEENRLALAIGDALGKGLAAALMITSVQSSLRTAALFTSDDLATMEMTRRVTTKTVAPVGMRAPMGQFANAWK
jgi:hypothetical protein